MSPQYFSFVYSIFATIVVTTFDTCLPGSGGHMTQGVRKRTFVRVPSGAMSFRGLTMPALPGISQNNWLAMATKMDPQVPQIMQFTGPSFASEVPVKSRVSSSLFFVAVNTTFQSFGSGPTSQSP